MQSIDFFWAFKKLKFNLNTKKQKNDIMFDWLKLKSYRLMPKPNDERMKEVDSSYISNIYSKYTQPIKEWEAKMLLIEKEEQAKENPKAPKRGPTLPTHYRGCDEAKNLYNQLTIQNRRMNNVDISVYKKQYAEHKKLRDALLPPPQKSSSRKQVPAKVSAKVTPDTNEETPGKQLEPEEQQTEVKVDDSPNMEQEPPKQLADEVEIKIVDEMNEEGQESLEKNEKEELELKQRDTTEFVPVKKHTSEFLEIPEQKTPEGLLKVPSEIKAADYESPAESGQDIPIPLKVPSKKKNYKIKYRVIQIKGQEVADNDVDRTFSTANGEIELKHFTQISLKKEIYEQLCSEVPIDKDDHNQIFMNIHKQKANKNNLIELLSTKQRIIPFSTNQDMHLQNNLCQLVGGEQQYYDMLHQLQGEDKDKDKKKIREEDELK